MRRRTFIKKSSAAGLLLSTTPIWNMGAFRPEAIPLTILHTNDVHSRLDPFPSGSGKYEGLGGVTRRATLISEIRANNPHVLLVDSGDMLQGTPYFNLYKGEVEFKAMNTMAYDVATLGNHDFDAGIDQLATNLELAQFDVVSANYRFDETPVNGKVNDYTIRTFDGLRIGFFGLGIELEGLVPKLWYGNTAYLDPVAKANETAATLRKKEDCDLVVCLSHLGYEYQNQKISDVVLAQSTKHIDVILGGHTHTFLDSPDVRRNLDGKPVIIGQVGWAGIKLGCLEMTFLPDKKKFEHTMSNKWVNEIGKEASSH